VLMFNANAIMGLRIVLNSVRLLDSGMSGTMLDRRQ